MLTARTVFDGVIPQFLVVAVGNDTSKFPSTTPLRVVVPLPTLRVGRRGLGVPSQIMSRQQVRGHTPGNYRIREKF